RPRAAGSARASGDRRAEVLGHLAAGYRFQRAPQELALEDRQPVDEQHAVQVIDLVLDRPRQVALGLEIQRLAVLVPGRDRDVARTGHLLVDPGDREAALLARLRAGAARDHRVHERPAFVALVLERHVHDQRAQEDPDLVRRQAHAAVGSHRVPEVRHQVPQRGVEIDHLDGLLAQHRIPVDPDRTYRHYLPSPVSTWTIDPFENSTLVPSAMLSTALESSSPTTVPKMPPWVSTRSPFLSSLSILSSCFWRWRWGLRIKR